MPRKPSILAVYGTRPEAIKLAPVLRALAADPEITVRIAVTGQHRGLLDEVNDFFHITPHIDLDIARPGQSLIQITERILAGLGPVLQQETPGLLLVHGDTTTSTVAALAGYYARIPVAHLEAGLRSGDLSSPYPEEGNRRLTAQLASLHLAPTAAARRNLLAENIPAEKITITGNTVIDALRYAAHHSHAPNDPRVRHAIASGRRIVLFTGHRRESWQGGLHDIAAAVATVVTGRPDVVVVAPLHPNPTVRDAIRPALSPLENVVLTEPLHYPEFAGLLAACHCVVTDSGGIQEEAPSLGKPVLVTRETTERPEAIQAGGARLVGTEPHQVAAELTALLDDTARYASMSQTISPYGDGHATARVVAALHSFFGIGRRLPDFHPDDHRPALMRPTPGARQYGTALTTARAS